KCTFGSFKCTFGSFKCTFYSAKSANGSVKSAKDSVKSANGSVKSTNGSVKSPKADSKLLPSKHSPDSSGSPLLCVGNGQAAATADSGTHLDTRRKHRLLIRIRNDKLGIKSVERD
ncbi:MAG: hypothetical protein WCL14_14300, partial [Bacteroidota bacterium]